MMPKTKKIIAPFLFAIVLMPKWATAQLTEVKAYDTAQNVNAASDRIFADAVKENMLGNSKEAQVLFLRFLEAKPKVAAAYYELARINSKENNATKALQNIEMAIKLDGDNKWYREMQGNILANANKFPEAADIFSNLAEKFQPNDEYLLKSSLLYQRSKQYPKAIAEIEKLIKLRGPDEELLMQINQLYLKQNKTDEAAKTLQRLIDANPDEGRYYALLAEMYLKQKNDTKAKEVFEKAEQKFPNDISVQLGLASYYKSKNDIEKYTEYVNKSVQNTSVDADIQVTLLVSYLQDMQADTASRENALMLATELVKKNDRNAPLMGLYDDLLATNNQPDKAIIAYKKTLAIDPANLGAWQQLLFLNTEKKDADSLIKLSGKALELYPSSAMLHYLNGIGYINKGNYKEGIAALITAIDFQPEDNKNLLAEMYSSLADAYNSSKDYKLADKNFDESLKLNPENATVLNNYAYYLSVRNVRLDDAEKFSAKSLQLRPGEATFLDTYGWIFYQQGKYEKAKALIQEAIDKNGKDADATLYEHLGDVNYKLNDTNKAVENWQKSIEKDPTNEAVKLKIKNRRIND